MVHLLMGEQRGLNPRMVDSQSTTLIHMATSAPTPAQGPGKASNKEVELFNDLTSLYLRLKIWARRAVIKALALHSGHVTSRRDQSSLLRALSMNWREDHQQIMYCSTHHLLGCHRPGDNQYEAVAGPSIELHHHISDDWISKIQIKTRNGWKSLSDGAGTAVD
ncbi:unnamed protein product [Victoria cruziana]